MRYLDQPRDQIFVKAMDFYLLLEIWVKKISKSVNGK